MKCDSPHCGTMRPSRLIDQSTAGSIISPQPVRRENGFRSLIQLLSDPQFACFSNAEATLPSEYWSFVRRATHKPEARRCTKRSDRYGRGVESDNGHDIKSPMNWLRTKTSSTIFDGTLRDHTEHF